MQPNTLQQNLTRRSLDFWREEGARAARVGTDPDGRFALLYDGHKTASATCHIAPDDCDLCRAEFMRGFKAARSCLY